MGSTEDYEKNTQIFLWYSYAAAALGKENVFESILFYMRNDGVGSEEVGHGINF